MSTVAALTAASIEPPVVATFNRLIAYRPQTLSSGRPVFRERTDRRPLATVVT